MFGEILKGAGFGSSEYILMLYACVCCFSIAMQRKRIKPVDAAKAAIVSSADKCFFKKQFISDDIGELMWHLPLLF